DTHSYSSTVSLEIASLAEHHIMWKTLIAWLALAILSPSSALTAEQLLCIGEQSAGFRWDGKSWVATIFSVEKDKFLVQETEPTKGLFGKLYSYEMRRFGSNELPTSCERPKSDTGMSSRIVCGGLGYGMLVDVELMRFQEVYGLGYINGQ